MSRAAFLLCPGRGSYGREELGWLHRKLEEGGEACGEIVATCEGLRRELDPGLPPLLDLDSASEFKPSLHLPGRQASPLIFLCTLLEHRLLPPDLVEPVVVGGNSLGFYTALVVSGALSLEAGYRLVSTMARLQEEGPRGGQVLWTLLDEDWEIVEERREILAGLLEDPEIDLSILLGGHVVLAGTEEGLRRLEKELPGVKLGSRDFPFRLPFHGPFHTELLRGVSEAAKEELSDLAMRPPETPLLDGRGRIWMPASTEPSSLLAYTLEGQVTRTFDFTAVVRVGLLEFAPERTLCLGPGSSLRAPLGHVESWIEKGLGPAGWVSPPRTSRPRSGT